MKKISPIHYLFASRFDTLIVLLFQNKFKIKKGKRLQLFAMLVLSLLEYPFFLIEELISKILFYNKKIDNQPLFILGFWRSGTTYLQNLLCEDKQFSYLNTITAYANNVCITLKPFAKMYMKKYADQFRFMDSMENEIDSPCEEEFAMANRSSKSIVHMSTFPKNFELYKRFIFTDEMTEKENKKWKKDYAKILKKVFFINKKKKMILKSPDNTGHSKELSQMFPESKFVYIYRNPYKVICSFKHTITKMIEYFSLQEMPPEEEIEDFVIDLYKRTIRQYQKDKENFKDRLIEIRYEDFVKEPLKYLEKIYSELDISGFENAKKNFENMINCQKDYKTNKYEISDRLKARIQKELKEVFDEYCYEM